MPKNVFGNSINYSRVRIDEKAQIGCRHWHFLYVSFYTYKCLGKFDGALLIHELVHVWQFQHFGGYIFRGQSEPYIQKEGYDYGGVSELKRALKEGKAFFDFNYEQQADIVTDYFRIKNGLRPQWGNGTRADLDTYIIMCENLFAF